MKSYAERMRRNSYILCISNFLLSASFPGQIGLVSHRNLCLYGTHGLFSPGEMVQNVEHLHLMSVFCIWWIFLHLPGKHAVGLRQE